MDNSGIPTDASTDLDSCLKAIENGHVVRLFPGANGEIILACYKKLPGSSAGEYEIEWRKPRKPTGMIADLVDNHTRVEPGGTRASSRFQSYQKLDELMRVIVSEYRAWIALGSEELERLQELMR